MPIDREGVRRPVPTGNACILDRYPQIVVRVLDDLMNVVAGKAAARRGGVGVPEKLMAVVTHQAVLRTEPYEALRVLQSHEHGALRKPVGRRQVLEDERSRVGGSRGCDACGRRPQ